MKSQSYHNFRQRIHQAAKEKSFPLRVMFELTYRCNFQCKHCYVPRSYRKYKSIRSPRGATLSSGRAQQPVAPFFLTDGQAVRPYLFEIPKRELKTKEVFSILDQLKDIGCFYLGFTGGEPFMRDDIMEILRYAKRCGFELIIYTNGALINANIAGQLARLRPNKVDITIPAMSKNAFERISGVPGSRDRVFRAIDLLDEKGVNLGFKTCVLKENENEISKIRDFAASLNAGHRLDDMLLPRLDGSKEPYRYRGRMTDGISLRQGYGGQGGQPALRSLGEAGRTEVSPSCVALAKQGRQRLEVRTQNRFDPCDLDALTETEHRTPTTETLFKCGVGVSQAAITPSGELKMCVMIDYPKYEALKNSLQDAWQKLRAAVKSIKADQNYRCDKCELAPYCKWCPARGWLADRNFTSCEPENRRWAEIRRQEL